MVTDCLIRTATLDDEDALREMRAAAGWAAEFVARALEEMASGARIVCVAEVDGRPVGSVQVLWNSDDPEMADGHRVAHLSDLVVHADYRGRGIARQLAEHVETLARARGYIVMTLDVNQSAPETQRRYERWGYQYYRQSISTWGNWLNGMRKMLVKPR